MNKALDDFELTEIVFIHGHNKINTISLTSHNFVYAIMSIKSSEKFTGQNHSGLNT